MPIKLLAAGLGCLLCVKSLAQSQEEVDALSLNVGINHTTDSNFDRTEEGEAESYTTAKFGVGLNRSSSRHAFRLDGSYRYSKYDERSDLDAGFPEALAQWRAQWSSKINTDLKWEKSGYQVSQDEFREKDVVERDDLEARFHFGESSGFVLGLGALLRVQRHSNEERSAYEFDEQASFGELALVTHAGSRIAVRQRLGNRDYLEAFLDGDELQDLDYDFSDTELEWSLKGVRESELTLIAGFSEREGEINNGEGPYLQLNAVYALGEVTKVFATAVSREPVVGEQTDAPTDEQLLQLGLQWQARPTLTLSTSAQLLNQEYGRDSANEEINNLVRDEKRYRFEVLRIQYQPEDFVQFYGSFIREERDSPLDYRLYETDIARLGLSFHF